MGDPEKRPILLYRHHLFPAHRPFFLSAVAPRLAELRDRANEALRLARQANGSAELHHGLIEGAGARSIQEGGCIFAEVLSSGG